MPTHRVNRSLQLVIFTNAIALFVIVVVVVVVIISFIALVNRAAVTHGTVSLVRETHRSRFAEEINRSTKIVSGTFHR